MKNIAHYLISGGVWPSGKSKVAKVKHSGTTRQRRDICGGDFISSLDGGCAPIAHCLRGFFLQVCIQGNTSLCFIVVLK